LNKKKHNQHNRFAESEIFERENRCDYKIGTREQRDFQRRNNIGPDPPLRPKIGIPKVEKQGIEGAPQRGNQTCQNYYEDKYQPEHIMPRNEMLMSDKISILFTPLPF